MATPSVLPRISPVQRQNRRPLGFYRLFRSRIDGEPIVVLIGTRSENRKTGNMVQTHILRADIAPHDATGSGADRSICGDCPLRHFTGGSCYVAEARGPLAAWKAWKRGRYVPLDLRQRWQCDTLENRALRIGTYGDPAAVPVAFWRALTIRVAGWTGYTHQWREPFAADLRPYVMASVESEEDARLAQSLGWRTFRVKGPDEQLASGEFTCPASAEAGHRLQCWQCLACNGNSGDANGRKASVAINVHGFYSRAGRVREPLAPYCPAWPCCLMRGGWDA